MYVCIYILNNNNNFLNREKVKSTTSFVVRGTIYLSYASSSSLQGKA